MPEKSQKRKLRSDQGISQEEIENCNASNDENVSLSEQDFEDISNKIENRLSKRLRDTEFGQREILRLIENLASKVDNLSNSVSEQCSFAVHFELETDPIENTGNESINRNVSSNMVTGVSANQQESAHQRSSSLPPPNQRYPDDFIDKLLHSLQTATTHNTGIPRLPKAMSTTMPTFDGKTDKFEHFEDLFQTSLKVYPNITEEEKIHYFHSLLRGEALQTFRNMTDATREHLNDILMTTVCQTTVSSNSTLQMGKSGVQPKPTNIPRLPRAVSKVSTRSLRGGRPSFHRNLLLRQNAPPSQEGSKPGQTRDRIILNNGPALGTRNRTQRTRHY